MKCPLRVNAIGDFGNCYESECVWWIDGCIVNNLANTKTSEPAQLIINADKLYTAEETAEYFNLKTSRVYDLARQKILPTVCIGRQLRFSGAAIQEFILSGGKKLP